MKVARKTIERVSKELFCDVGKYRYILKDNMGFWPEIQRRKISELGTLPKYGPAWETVARYNMDAEKWEVI